MGEQGQTRGANPHSLDPRGVALTVAVALAAAVALLAAFPPQAAEPRFKPYWVDINYTEYVAEAERIGITLGDGEGRTMVVGFLDTENNVVNRSVVASIVEMGLKRGYKVVFVPMTNDNRTAKTYAHIKCDPQLLLGFLRGANISGDLCPEYAGYFNATPQGEAFRLSLELRRDYERYSIACPPGVACVPATYNVPDVLYVYIVDEKALEVLASKYPEEVALARSVLYEPYRPTDTAENYLRKIGSILDNLSAQ